MSKAKILKMLAEAMENTAKGKTTKTKKKSSKKEDVNRIVGAGDKAEPQKGHLKKVDGKVGKVKDEQKHKGLDKPNMGKFAVQQARGAKKAEGKMTAFEKLQRDYESLTKKYKMAEVAKGKNSKYYSVIKKIGKGYAGGGDIQPAAIKTKGQFESLLSKGKLEHIPNDKLVDIAIRVGYITGDEMMGNAKGGVMMKKKGMAMGGLKKPAAGQTGLKKLPSSVRNKMGYAKKGGSMKKKKGYAMGGVMKKKGMAAGGLKKYGTVYRSGGADPGKMYGSVDNKKKK